MEIQKAEELRCMDYIQQNNTLYVGTNQKNILTINIEQLLDPRIAMVDESIMLE